MKYGSKGMTCSEFVKLMKERGISYNEKSGGFLTAKKKIAGKTTRNGYRTLTLQKNNVNYTFCEHRCVWTWFNGEIPDRMEINHKDFDRSNNKIENLEIVTHSENMEHVKNAGRMHVARGQINGKSVWTDKEAQAMKFLRKDGWKVKEIARLFGGNYENVVGRIVNGHRYGHVPDAADVMSVYPAIVMQTMNHDLSRKDQILNGAIGLCGESGEVVDIIKKHFFQGHDLDVDHLIEEIGDVLYYITLLMILLDYNMADTEFNNMCKLNNRYPKGFSVDLSNHRKEGDV